MNQEQNYSVAVPPIERPSSRHMALKATIPAVIILALSGAGILYGQRIVDHAKASMFHPTAQVAQVEARLQLTDRGRDVFYSTQPLVESKTEFNNNCQSEERTAAILGCYYRDHIYLYDINNPELDGTLEVTAAHEMLHAAYQRLNWFERQRVDALVKTQYEKTRNDANLREAMRYYSQAEPGSEINELHSILGTTVVELDPELSRYYAQYFKDRSAVVALNAQYNKVFGDLKAKALALEQKIKAAEPTLTEDLAAYESDRTMLESDIESFNQQAASGAYSSAIAFNSARHSLLARVDALNARREAINARVADYNADVAALNALSVQAGDLYKSINGAETTTGV